VGNQFNQKEMTNGILRKQGLSIVWIVYLLISIFSLPVSGESRLRKDSSSRLVILELFTSQGCSSCPPADKLLAEYALSGNIHIIPISFHVDYWNRLGWTDPFSNHLFSERQQWYSNHLPKGSVYTPQLIINGRGEAVGSDRNLIRQLVQKELSISSEEAISINEISIEKESLAFHYVINHLQKEEVLNIALIKKQVTTHIGAGENKGSILTNHNIVMAFKTIHADSDGHSVISLPASFSKEVYSLVLYTQDKKTLFINAGLLKDL